MCFEFSWDKYNYYFFTSKLYHLINGVPANDKIALIKYKTATIAKITRITLAKGAGNAI